MVVFARSADLRGLSLDWSPSASSFIEMREGIECLRLSTPHSSGNCTSANLNWPEGGGDTGHTGCKGCKCKEPHPQDLHMALEVEEQEFLETLLILMKK